MYWLLYLAAYQERRNRNWAVFTLDHQDAHLIILPCSPSSTTSVPYTKVYLDLNKTHTPALCHGGMGREDYVCDGQICPRKSHWLPFPPFWFVGSVPICSYKRGLPVSLRALRALVVGLLVRARIPRLQAPASAMRLGAGCAISDAVSMSVRACPRCLTGLLDDGSPLSAGLLMGGTWSSGRPSPSLKALPGVPSVRLQKNCFGEKFSQMFL